MDFISPIVEAIITNYWCIVEQFSKISDAYGTIAEATWLTELCNNLRNLCTGKLMPAFSGVGLAVALTYFLISIIGLVTEDRFTPEFLAKFFAKLVISVAVIMWSGALLTGIIDFGDAMGKMFTGWTANDFMSANTNINDAFDTFANTFANSVAKDLGCTASGNYSTGFSFSSGLTPAKFLKILGLGISMSIANGLLMIVAFLALPIMNAAVYFVEISRNMELYIRGSLLPIAAGVMADDGWRGAGGRYFKKILALASQKVVLSLTCVMTGAMTTNYIVSQLIAVSEKGTMRFIGESFAMIGTASVICFAGISFLFKSLQVVNDLWGAS